MNVNRLLMLTSLVLSAAIVTLIARPRHHYAPPLPDLSRIDSQTAIELEQTHAQCDSSSPGNLAMLAERYFVTGYFPEAEACYRRACELDPQNGALWFDWAFCLSHSGRMEESIKAFRKAAELDSEKRIGAWYFIGRNYLRSGDVPAALNAFNEIRGLPAVQFEINKQHLRSGNAGKAITSLRKLCDAHPESATFFYWAARAEAMLGNDVAAKVRRDQAYWAPGRAPSPFEPESLRWASVQQSFGLAKLAFDAGELMQDEAFSEGEAKAQQALENRWDPRVADYLVAVKLQERDSDAAISTIREIIQRDGPDMHRQWRLADGLTQKGRMTEAEGAWVQAQRLGRGRHSELGRLHQVLSEWYERNRMDTGEAKRHAGLQSYHSGVGLLFEGNRSDAILALRQATEADPKNADAWFYFGEARRMADLAKGSPPSPESRQAYQRCLQLDPHHGRALNALATE